MMPDGESGLLGDILEDDGPCLHETASRDGTVLVVEDRLLRAAAGHSSTRGLLWLPCGDYRGRSNAQRESERNANCRKQEDGRRPQAFDTSLNVAA